MEDTGVLVEAEWQGNDKFVLESTGPLVQEQISLELIFEPLNVNGQSSVDRRASAPQNLTLLIRSNQTGLR